MAEVPSTFELGLGSRAPDFTLPDGRGEPFTLDQVRGDKGLLVAFACNHCPFVIHLADELGRLAAEIEEAGINTVVINANDVDNYPQDEPEKMVVFADQHGWSMPYLYDQSQQVAKEYGAACTPDFFLFDEDLRLVYAGQFDESRPGNGKPVTGASLRAAVDAMLSDAEPVQTQVPSSGCNIKWKPGNEPDYFGH